MKTLICLLFKKFCIEFHFIIKAVCSIWVFSDSSKLQLFSDGFYFLSPQIHIQLAILFNILQHSFWLVDYSTDLYNPVSHWFTQDSDFEWQEQVVDFCTHFFTEAIHIRHAENSNSLHINLQCQFDDKSCPCIML